MDSRGIEYRQIHGDVPETIRGVTLNSPNLRGLVVVVTIAVMAGSGCASLSSSLREMIDDGRHVKAAEKGQKWLDGHAGKPKYRQEAGVIGLLVCEAELLMAKGVDNVDAYRHFRRKYAGMSGASGFLNDALLAEASAFYRDETTRRNTIQSYQEFQSKYPNARERGQALAREAELVLKEAETKSGTAALRQFIGDYGQRPDAAPSVSRARQLLVNREYDKAMAEGTDDALRRFRVEFEEWPEASSLLADLRQQECRLAFEKAEKTGTAIGFRNFRAYYGTWPEAVEMEPAAYDAEAGLELDQAVKKGDFDGLGELRSVYTRGDWPARFEDGMAIVSVDVISNLVDNRIALAPGGVESILLRAEPLPTFLERGKSIRQAVATFARNQKSGSMLYLAHRLFAGEPEGLKLAGQAEAAFWKYVNDVDDADEWLRFSRWFPLSRYASQAEQRYLWHMELRNPYAFGLYGRVTRTIRQPNGDVDVYVDVRNARGERVSGLTKDAFRLFRGSQNAEIVGFWGMEEDRPLDIVFAIDMSGSMETEREAVRQAVSFFANHFAFRGREARLGLVSFSDQVIDRNSATPDYRKFMNWMSNLNNTTGGGSGEDGVMAMLDSLVMLRAGRGEKVVIFLSDEPFQTNIGGRNALKVKSDDRCSRVRSWITCRDKCRLDDSRGQLRAIGQDWARCEGRCIGFLGSEATGVLKKCTSRYQLQNCVRDNVFDRIANGMYSGCGEPIVWGESAETKKLITELDRSQVRPFFLVTRGNIGGASSYDRMASSLQGQILQVPDDETSPQPYVDALMEIAELLSRQYVIRYRPTAMMKKDSALQVVVRPIHRWSSFGRTPKGEIKALYTLSDSRDCPEFMMFSSDSIYVSKSCGKDWERLDVNLPSPIVDVRTGRGWALVQTADGALSLWDIERRQMHALQFGLERLLGFSWDGADRFWVTGFGADKSLITEYRLVSDFQNVASAFSIPAEPAFGAGGRMMAYPVTIRLEDVSPGKVCVLVAADRMMCSTDDPAVWVSSKVTGLSAAALAGPSSLMRIDSHDRILLLSGADGAVYRSISDGLSWNRVLDPVAGGRTLQVFKTTPELLCASSSRDVQCSEDSGLRFFPLGLGFIEKGGAAMSAVNGLPVLAAEGEMQSLFRVLNREIPSSALYFATNESEPSDEMLPFLSEIARGMLASPDSVLRIEGHADSRGASDYNEELARRRAEAVARTIVEYGVPEERIIVLSYGERRPLQGGGSQRALSRNRRVELILLKKTPDKWFAP